MKDLPMARKRKSNLQQRIFSYFIQNPNPTDEEFHEWMDDEGITYEQAYPVIYEMMSKFADLATQGFSKGEAPEDLDPEQLEMGIEVEYEHTDDYETARKIAYDHLTEFPDYYDALEEMEDKLLEKMEEEDPDRYAELKSLETVPSKRPRRKFTFKNRAFAFLIGGGALVFLLMLAMTQ